MINKRKKVLIVAHYPPPYGGISSHIRDITKRLISTDFSIFIVSFEKKEDQLELNEHLNLYRECNKIKFSLILSYLKNIFSITKIFYYLWFKKISLRNFFSALNRSLIVNSYLNKFKIETVAIYETKTGAIIPFLKLLNPNLKICFTYYAGPIKDKKFFLKNLSFWKEVFLKSDRLSSSSKYCAEGGFVISQNISPRIIYVGVELSRFHLKSDNFFLNKKIKKILFVGRMFEEMGVKSVIEIAEKTVNLREDVVFDIIGGSGPLSKQVSDLSENNLGKINYQFDVSDTELNEYINNADILIAPTVGSHACMGVSAKEALACGIPVIASNSGGLPEAIENEVEGFVVPLVDYNIDVNGFCQSIHTLCNNDELRLKMGKRARQKAERLFCNKITEKKVSMFYTF